MKCFETFTTVTVLESVIDSLVTGICQLRLGHESEMFGLFVVYSL